MQALRTTFRASGSLSRSPLVPVCEAQRRHISTALTWIDEDIKYKSPYSKQSGNRPRSFDYQNELKTEKGGLKKRLGQQEKQRSLVKQEIDYLVSDESQLSADKLVRASKYRDVEPTVLRETVPGEISQIEYLQNIIPKFVEEVIKDKGHIYLKVQPRYLPLVQKFLYLHMNTQVKMCSDITAVDYLYKKRFQLVYNLKSLVYNQQYFVKLWLGAEEFVASSKNMYPSALWYEREVYDMFGIQFMGERETRRMLNDYGFKGHPLRKDFPLSGFTEVYYDSRTAELAYKPVSLVQEYRFYNRPSPWSSKRGTLNKIQYGEVPEDERQ